MIYTVKELISKLEQMPQDITVVCNHSSCVLINIENVELKEVFADTFYGNLYDSYDDLKGDVKVCCVS